MNQPLPDTEPRCHSDCCSKSDVCVRWLQRHQGGIIHTTLLTSDHDRKFGCRHFIPVVTMQQKEIKL